MVDIQPIKNQYLTALKERQQIIDKVNEIIRDLNNLNFDDLINLNNKIEEIKTEIAQIESELTSYNSRLTTNEDAINGLSNNFNSFETETENTLNSKVNKSGDTITGILSITSISGTPRMYMKHPSLDITTTPTSNCFIDQEYLDKNGKRFALIESLASANSPTRQIGIMINSSNVGDTWHRLQLTHDGTSAYVTAPSWSVGTNDNSDKILTIKMANSLPSLMHTVGNETIAGNKSFTGIIDITNSIILKGNENNPDIIMRRSGTNAVNMGVFIGDTSYTALTISTSGKSIAIGSDTVKPYANTPQSNARGTEIATAEWVIARINEFASKNNLNGL